MFQRRPRAQKKKKEEEEDYAGNIAQPVPKGTGLLKPGFSPV